MSEPQPPRFTGDDGQSRGEPVPGEFIFRSSPLPPVKTEEVESKPRFGTPDDNDCPSTGRTPSPLGYKPTGNPKNRKLVSLEYRLITLTGLSWQP